MTNNRENTAEKVLTVSVAAYNAKGWLSHCLESLVSTRVSSALDVIVVNDGSKDGTLGIARSFEAEHPGIVRVADKENGGHGSTINAAIRLARGRYFKIVDADDWVERDGIERLVGALEHADCDLALNSFFEVDAGTGEKRLCDDIFDGGANRIGEAMGIDEAKGDLHLVMHAMTFRTKLLQDSTYRLDEHCFYVDNEYIVYYFSVCETLMLLDWPVYNYLLGTSEQSMNFSNLLRRRDQHERVCLACAEFYSEHADLPGRRGQVVRSVATRMAAGTYRILICLPYDMSCRETGDFDKRLEGSSALLYDSFLEDKAGESISKVVSRLRASGFKRYRAINLLYRIKYRCLKEDAVSLGGAQ